MKQNHYRVPIKRPLAACVALLGLSKVKYASIRRKSTQAKAGYMSEMVYNALFFVASVILVLLLSAFAYGILFIFSI